MLLKIVRIGLCGHEGVQLIPASSVTTDAIFCCIEFLRAISFISDIKIIPDLLLQII